MHTYYQAKEMLHKELEELIKQGDLSSVSLEMIDKLLNSIKNADKIIMYEEYAEDGYSYADTDADLTGYSQARGRGRNAKRDSLGRYSRADGYSNGRGYSRRGGYSYADGKDERMQMLEDMMAEAKSEQERQMIRNLMNQMNG